MNSEGVLTITHDRASDGTVTLVIRSSHMSDYELAMKSRSFSLPLKARYADFSLVRPFVQLILITRSKFLKIDYLCTETADLARFAISLGVAVTIMDGMQAVVMGDSKADHRWGTPLLSFLQSQSKTDPLVSSGDRHFGYEKYAFGSRDHNVLIDWVDRVSRWFDGRQSILDVGCGTGVFLDQMARRGLSARGIDSNLASVRYAELLGLDARVADVREALQVSEETYDALHCAHFVEHVTPDELSEFMALVYRVLRPGGRAVFVFPDPESIRSQLLGFWRDPTHVRFYHSDIVASMGEVAGLSVEYNSQRADGRVVIPFSFDPPMDDVGHQCSDNATTNLDPNIKRQLAVLEDRVALQEKWIRQLWMVNQTWAWPDDVVLCLEKPNHS